MLSTLQDRAVSKAQGQEVFVDPATILLIGKIIQEVIGIIKRCREARQGDMDVEEVAHNPGWRGARQVYRTTRRRMGWRSYRRNGGDEIVQAVLDTGRETTGEELEMAFLEV